MGFEIPKTLTAEEKEKTKSRMISDGELAQEGAKIRDDGSLEVTESQVQQAKIEMEKEKGFYSEKANVNGMNISVGWDGEYEDYTIYFPDLKISSEASQRGVYDQVIRIGVNRKVAKEVFDYAVREAAQEKDLSSLWLKTNKFIAGLDNQPQEVPKTIVQEIIERSKSASQKVQSRIQERIIPNMQRQGDRAEFQLEGMRNDFYQMVEDPDNSEFGDNYKGWTPDEVKELFTVLYGEAM